MAASAPEKQKENMTATHVVVIVFILITAAFVIWLEINSRQNAKKRERDE
jgi:hypothetical protein